jgi:hypothetical protein
MIKKIDKNNKNNKLKNILDLVTGLTSETRYLAYEISITHRMMK